MEYFGHVVLFGISKHCSKSLEDIWAESYH